MLGLEQSAGASRRVASDPPRARDRRGARDDFDEARARLSFLPSTASSLPLPFLRPPVVASLPFLLPLLLLLPRHVALCSSCSRPGRRRRRSHAGEPCPSSCGLSPSRPPDLPLSQLAYPFPYNSPLNSNTPEASKDYSMTSPLVNSGIYPCKVRLLRFYSRASTDRRAQPADARSPIPRATSVRPIRARARAGQLARLSRCRSLA